MSFFFFCLGILGVFMAGCAFQSAINGEGMLNGAIPPWTSAIIAVGAAISWASMAFNAASN